jgi:hypothetical protein
VCSVTSPHHLQTQAMGSFLRCSRYAACLAITHGGALQYRPFRWTSVPHSMHLGSGPGLALDGCGTLVRYPAFFAAMHGFAEQ